MAMMCSTLKKAKSTCSMPGLDDDIEVSPDILSEIAEKKVISDVVRGSSALNRS